MTQEEILSLITQLKEVNASDELVATVLAAATNTISLDKLNSLVDNKQQENKRTAKTPFEGKTVRKRQNF